MENKTPENNQQQYEPQLPFTYRTEHKETADTQIDNTAQTSQTPQPEEANTEHISTQSEQMPYTQQVPQYQQPVQRSPYREYPQYQQPVQRNAYGEYSQYQQSTAPNGVYGNPSVNQPYGYTQQTPPQYPYPPQQYTQNPYGQYPPNPYNAPVQSTPPQPKKMSIGLYIIITVLSILLVASATGLVVYIATSSGNSKPAEKDSNSYLDDFFDEYSKDFTLPNYDEKDKTPDLNSNAHPETDYSDKVNKDYSGLKLNEKPADADSSKSYNTGYAINQIQDSVVGIVCYSGKETGVDKSTTQGSGVIISSDGYVLTNSHVIGDSKTKYALEVVTSDSKVYKAGVVGFDSRKDIALLKLDNAKNLKAAEFGDSSLLKIGDDIVVVGNPGGLQYSNSSTKGIVSAVDRELSSSALVKYIQTDAAINPGNSGGPLVNEYGQVVGIATAKIVSEDFEGMGFAIPSAAIKQIVDSLMKNGYVDGRVKLGITGTEISAYMAQLRDIPQGIIVAEITKDGPCDNTDLQKNDIITGVDKKEIKSFADVYSILENHKDGDKIEVKFYRQSEDKEYTIEVKLQADKE